MVIGEAITDASKKPIIQILLFCWASPSNISRPAFSWAVTTKVEATSQLKVLFASRTPVEVIRTHEVVRECTPLSFICSDSSRRDTRMRSN